MTTFYGDQRTKTLLSLARYAQEMNIDPIRFFGGTTNLRSTGACDDVWYEYSWQDGEKVSRQEILAEIARAEYEIAQFLGFWPAPVWIQDEPHQHPQFFNGRWKHTQPQRRWNNSTVKLDFGHVLYGGVRATTEITTATRGANIDTTGDTYEDMAVWTITGVDFTASQIHAYFKEYSAGDAENTRTDPESVGADEVWRVRDIRIRYDSSTETATVYIPRYQLFQPQLQRQIDVSVIDADDDTNYVDDLIFYRVYNDPSDQVTFLWTHDEACSTTACAWATQTGCISVKDDRLGQVFLTPGTYSDGSYTEQEWSQTIDAHKALVNYCAGYVDPYARGADQLSPFFAKTIAKLATTRIPKKFCLCENIQTRVDAWQEDTSIANTVRSYTVAPNQNNPFGTKKGEVDVYRSLNGRYGLRVRKGINPYT